MELLFVVKLFQIFQIFIQKKSASSTSLLFSGFSQIWVSNKWPGLQSWKSESQKRKKSRVRVFSFFWWLLSIALCEGALCAPPPFWRYLIIFAAQWQKYKLWKIMSSAGNLDGGASLVSGHHHNHHHHHHHRQSLEKLRTHSSQLWSGHSF